VVGGRGMTVMVEGTTDTTPELEAEDTGAAGIVPVEVANAIVT
jgi:hypothetical protein